MIHIEKKHILPDVYASIKFQIILKRFISNINLTDTEVEILSIFYIHGITDESIDFIVEKKIYKNVQSVLNTITKFTKLGIVKKEKGKKLLTNLLDIETGDQDNKILMTVKIGNR